ncbi:tryptophan dimethylallyltransferase family protein [Actinokineospora pegani]|uniref:tryptophan dimethylallyltransferase family protein n=1 Tax=Actinokineospora pegani TaxID=2654637 RepID=UPI0012EA771D|nr:tryptophan dimethylallyltransferase family protein [Actinokineospora pegani]
MRAVSVNEFTGAQLQRLCAAVGLTHRAAEAQEVLADVLGPSGTRSLAEPPPWGSDIADDHSPVEYSVAFEEDGSHTLRLLVEAGAHKPGPRANLTAALAALDRLADRYPVALDKLDRVRDLFLPDEPQGVFALWFSIVVRGDRPPMVKVYLNPLVRGADRADELVATGLDRLGFTGSFDWISRHTPRGDKGLDQFSFFALDLEETEAARVKLYQSHHRAGARDAQRAAGATEAADTGRIAEFTSMIGGDGPFLGRPLVSSHTFLASDSARPKGYSLYVPVRDYVHDDVEALSRVRAMLTRYGVDGSALERAVRAVTDRDLAAGVGLLAHVSLRMGPPRPGVTVYLSAEAYEVAPPGGKRAAGAA